MRKKPYSLWKRTLNSGTLVYYLRFRLEDGSWAAGKWKGK
jgi:hypothetical protein